MDRPGASDDNLTYLVEIKQTTGRSLHLKPFDRITKVVAPSDEQIVVQVITHELRERKFDTHLIKQGIKLIPINFVQATNTWVIGQSITVWNEDFEPVRVAAFTPPTIEEFWQKRNHETMCGRPGTPSYPLEPASFADCSTPAIRRHWTL